jgi:hypothetical protein
MVLWVPGMEREDRGVEEGIRESHMVRLRRVDRTTEGKMRTMRRCKRIPGN